MSNKIIWNNYKATFYDLCFKIIKVESLKYIDCFVTTMKVQSWFLLKLNFNTSDLYLTPTWKLDIYFQFLRSYFSVCLDTFYLNMSFVYLSKEMKIYWVGYQGEKIFVRILKNTKDCELKYSNLFIGVNEEFFVNLSQGPVVWIINNL